ncbi:MAG TPA: thrombospondin type 3 repeat-containing protein [Kofleriaceae bacterium]|nr:thrombospondin type 3 repeat-containing protein [Kofleriaceae bacterium]
MSSVPLRYASFLLLTSALVFGLTGCGGCGGDDEPGDPDSANPDSANPDAPDPDAGPDAGTDAMPDGMPATVMQCPTQLAAPTTGDCDVTTGTGSAVVLQGTVLGLGTTYLDGAVVYDGNLITYVGCDPSGAPGFATAKRINCGDNVISPGLINAHDHVTYNNRAPLASTAAHDPRRYGHRNDWRDAWPTPPNQYGNTSSNTDGVRWNEIRHVLAGTTSMTGSGHADGMVRNLDDVAAAEFALGFERLQYEVFILNDNSTNEHTIPANCGWNFEYDEREVKALDSLVSHASEGIDSRSRAEFQCQRTSFGGGQDFVENNTAHVHVVAANATDYYDMATDGSVLVWSPRSNISLFGNTSQAQVMHRLGGTVAIGTDWTYTGSANMLRELACVDELNQNYLDDAFTDEDIWKMATINAALSGRSEELIGSLTTGKLADIAIFRATAGETYRAVIAAGDADVALVVRDGDVLYGEDDVVAALSATACETVTVCTQSRRICAQREFNQTFATLAGNVPLAYPAIICTPPADEPTCLPSRMNEYDGITATDMDGDGRADAMDNCPRTFNPIRPMDSGVQADVDGDGMGDACDPTPVGTDLDNDTIANATDNCPFTSNTSQTNGDGDMNGDVCDFCPGLSSPGDVCPATIVDDTIYDIKNGTTAVGTMVRVSNAIVTGKGSNGFFMQVKAGDTGDLGANYSGIFVFTNTGSFLTSVQVGNRVTVEGRVAVFGGQTEIDMVTMGTIVNASVETAPAPVTATAAEITTGGSRAAQLEGVVVQVGMSSATAVNAGAGEFTLTDTSGAIVVDDFLHVPSPAITVGRAFTSVSGVLAQRTGSKLLPRGASDFVAGAPAILTFAPATSFVYEAQNGVPTVPTALTVTLNGPAPSPGVTVPITSSNEAVLTIPGGGVTVPTGMSSASVLVNGLTAGTVTLTATLGGTRSADVRVIGASEQPVLQTLTPTTPSMFAGTSITFTVTLDIPAPAGGTTVALSVNPSTAGVLPAMLTVPAGQVSHTFSYMDASMVSSATVSATLGAVTRNATVTVTQATNALMINEVDYDQVGTDMTEYIELFNGTSSAYPLANIELIMINGSGTAAEYKRIPLAPATSIPSGGYLVISTSAVTVQGAGVRYTPPTTLWPTMDAVQNGGTAATPSSDGIILANTSTNTVIDKLAYEGALSITITGFGLINLAEGTMTAAFDDPAAPHSLSRIPNGTDTNNAANDWAASNTLTPGAANAP